MVTKINTFDIMGKLYEFRIMNNIWTVRKLIDSLNEVKMIHSSMNVSGYLLHEKIVLSCIKTTTTYLYQRRHIAFNDCNYK